jgi:glycolate oxidase FAD binding subunit
VADDIRLRDLMAACPATREAGEADAVAGVVPGYAASPASVEEASALMKAAAGHDLTVVARGGGTKLDWGAPPRRCDLVIDTVALNEVLEHAAGDLVAKVQAGVRMDTLAEVLAKAGQQLALDAPPAMPDGTAAAHLAAAPQSATVGGALATGAAGPRRLRYGTPRDLIIGITVVRPDGVVAKSGGKVVKNVAGYDLGKLFAGSYGTLGLIVEVTFRLHPLPAGVAYVTRECADAAQAYEAVAAAAASELAPSAVEIDRPGRGQPAGVSVLLEGDPTGVTERGGLMRALLGGGADVATTPPVWWGWPGAPDAPEGGGAAREVRGGTLLRIAFWAAGLPRVLAVIDAAGAVAGLDPAVGGSAAAGVLHAAVGADADPAAVAVFVSAVRDAFGRGEGDARPEQAVAADAPPLLASALVVHAPPAVRGLVDPWGPVPSLGLMRAVKEQFDPGYVMAPGRFAGGL